MCLFKNLQVNLKVLKDEIPLEEHTIAEFFAYRRSKTRKLQLYQQVRTSKKCVILRHTFQKLYVLWNKQRQSQTVISVHNFHSFFQNLIRRFMLGKCRKNQTITSQPWQSFVKFFGATKPLKMAFTAILTLAWLERAREGGKKTHKTVRRNLL